MIATFGLLFSIAVLVFWLLGGWFARVLAFVALVVVLGGVGALTAGSAVGAQNHGAWGFVIGVLLAWSISGIPVYYRRSKSVWSAALGGASIARMGDSHTGGYG